ncbi:DUF3710 domain-containing protein [Streptomyces sp. NPDC020983]|uniref:DUF3710 domain-containing protein n=1 Tax=Streptomyces sp. NPDC020983 TaxID=3365106 RepID=UPI003795F6CA
MSEWTGEKADGRELQEFQRNAALVDTSERAADILRQFERLGTLTETSRTAAEFNGTNAMRATPGYALFGALVGELIMRMSDQQWRVDSVLNGLPPVIDPRDALRLIELSVGNIGGGQHHAGRGGELTLDTVVALLSAVWEQSGRSESQRRDLLLAAAGTASNLERAVDEGDISWGRGRVTGPWDIEEVTSGTPGWRSETPEGTTRHDFGGLQVPFDPDRVQWKLVAPAPGAEAEAFAIHLMDGRTVIQLDLFRADPSRPWTQLCSELVQNMIASGGTAELAAGPMGPEVRGTIGAAVSGNPGSQKDVRFLGCQGPGWLLRATVWGAAAAPHSNEPWPYDVCTGTVVNAKQGSPEPGAHILLRLPDTYGK